MSGQDMAVDTIVACRDLAPWKPLPMVVGDAGFGQGLGRLGQGRGGLLVPVQLLGLVRPEGLWVGEGVVVDLVLGVGHGVEEMSRFTRVWCCSFSESDVSGE